MNRSIRLAAVLSIALLTACSDDPTGTERVVVDRVEVGPADQVVMVGDSTIVRAVPLTADGDTVQGPILWRTLSPAVATLRVSGGTAVVEAKAPGTARIEAESGGRTGFVNVTVEAAPPPPPQIATVEITPSQFALPMNAQTPLQAIAKTAAGEIVEGRAITWTSSAEHIATVEPIGVSPFASVHSKTTAGITVIRATIDGVVGESTLEVTVIAPPPPPQQIQVLTFYPNRRGVWVNQVLSYSQHLIAIGPDGTIPNPDVAWAVEDSTIAAVDANGNVRGLRAGTTNVRASGGDRIALALVTVFEAPGAVAVYDLTYDWWDGQWHIMPEVGTEPWTDEVGGQHQAKLYPVAGTLTMTSTGEYERMLVLEGWVQWNGGSRKVITRQMVDRGTAGIIVGGETGYWMSSTTTPGYTYKVVGAYNAGHVTMRAVVGTAPEQDYLFRLHQ